MYSDYIDQKDKHKGFIVTYGGGDFCEEEWTERKTRFEYHCDPSIDFEVRSLDKSKPCEFTFQIYSSKACHVLPGSPYKPLATIASYSSSGHNGVTGFFFKVYDFYKGIFLLVVRALYYLLVCFVIYCIIRVIQIVWNERSQSTLGKTSFTKSIPVKDRAIYYYNRIKASILGQ
jgi:hypothetical protein